MSIKREVTKGDLLEHYAGKEPKPFIQYDCFVDAKPDDVMSPDADGDGLFCLDTHELMYGSSVRVLITPETSRGDAIRALRKIRKWIKDDGLWDGEFFPRLMEEGICQNDESKCFMMASHVCFRDEDNRKPEKPSCPFVEKGMSNRLADMQAANS